MIYRILYISAAIWISIYTVSYGVWEHRRKSRSSSGIVYALAVIGGLMAVTAAMVY